MHRSILSADCKETYECPTLYWVDAFGPRDLAKSHGTSKVNVNGNEWDGVTNAEFNSGETVFARSVNYFYCTEFFYTFPLEFCW